MTWSERPEYWNRQFFVYLNSNGGPSDAAHDLLHLQRVLKNALELAASFSEINLNVLVPAVWLHDLVLVPKSHPDRKSASAMSAAAAVTALRADGYAPHLLDAIGHAITAHSFSAAVSPVSLEAKILQDADRLDALGAIGIARCFATGAAINRPFYNTEDPFCSSRLPDDGNFTIDHFFAKLLSLETAMQTEAGKREANRRTRTLKGFLEDFQREIS